MRHNTDTTEFDDFGREARELHDGHRLAVRRQAEELAQRLAHRVAADVRVVEHEGVARIDAHRFDALHQLVIDHARGTVLEFAHALVDQCDEVGEPIGHRRIARVTRGLGVVALEHRAVARAVLLRVVALRQRDQFGEDRDLFVHAGAAGEEDVDRLFEIEQPERQFQVARIEHQRAIAEAARILVVAVEQEQAQVRPRIEDLAQDQRNAARLADAGGAEDREMLAQHVVHVHVRADGGVLLEVADVDRVGTGDIVDQPQFVARDQGGGISDCRIVRDAALEVLRAVVALSDLAHHVETRRGAVTSLASGCADVLRDLRHHADEHRLRALDAQELADRDRGLALAYGVDAAGRKPDGRLRSAHRQDVSAGAIGVRAGSGNCHFFSAHRRLRVFEHATGGPPSAACARTNGSSYQPAL